RRPWFDQLASGRATSLTFSDRKSTWHFSRRLAGRAGSLVAIASREEISARLCRTPHSTGLRGAVNRRADRGRTPTGGAHRPDADPSHGTAARVGSAAMAAGVQIAFIAILRFVRRWLRETDRIIKDSGTAA